MSASFEHYKTELAGLPSGQRAELALFLIHSLDQEVDVDADEAWEEEIQRRVADIKSGRAQGIPAEQVFANLRKPRS